MNESPITNGDGVKKSGFVYTFYSYKGGVGRSMAMVNVGVLMALWGHRVLLVDWDLEAPGLEAFFKKNAKLNREPGSTPGIIDLLEARISGSILDWSACKLMAEFIGSSLDIISAGRKSPDYRSRVQKLNWDSLFREHRIGNYINALRDEWRNAYDFVLIDSRTGITDIGDICTVLLPDVLVLLFVTNYQNVDGIKDVIERARAARKKLPVDRARLLGIPVLGRDEVYNEYEKSLEWKRIFSRELGYLYNEWLPKEIEPSDALNKLFIPYVTNWSFGERIPILENDRELQDPTTIGAAYARLATLLVNNLDWYALEQRATAGDLQGTRIELQRVREEAHTARQQAKDYLVRQRKWRWRALIGGVLVLIFAGIIVYATLFRSVPVAVEISIGDELRQQGKPDEALEVYLARKKKFEDLAAQDANNIEWKRELVVTYNRIGDLLLEKHKLDEALTSYQKADEIFNSLKPTEVSSTELQRILAVMKSNIGDLLRDQGKSDEALAAYMVGQKTLDSLTVQDPGKTEWQRELAATNNKIGDVLHGQGKLNEALVAYQKGKAILERLTARDLSSAEWQRELAATNNKIGDVLRDQGKLSEAVAAYRKGTTISGPLKATEKYIAAARLHRNQGDYAAALAELGKAKGISPTNQEVRAEIEMTRRACSAEKQLGRTGLSCETNY